MFFCFCIFLVDQRKYKKSDPRAGTQERLNKRQPKLQTTCPQSQTRAPMGSAVLFFDFQGFCVVCSGWPEPRKSKQKQKKTILQTTCPQSQTRAPMGSAVLFFLLFCFFEVFAWFALLYTVVITSNCPLLCEIHVEPFKTLQNQNFHIPPPSPPALFFSVHS